MDMRGKRRDALRPVRIPSDHDPRVRGDPSERSSLAVRKVCCATKNERKGM